MIEDFKKNILTKEIFNEVEKNIPYYENRWDYFSEIIEQLRKLDDIHHVLEFGPYKLPLVKGEDIIDITDEYSKDYPYEINKLITHNCCRYPLPIEDKSYDLVIASQVVEHYGMSGQQVEFFNELERITRIAIVSLPYKWFAPLHRDHHMVDKNMIKAWSGNRKPVFEMISGKNEKTLRILQIYDFENGSSITEADKFRFKGYVHKSKLKDDRIERLVKQNDELKKIRSDLIKQRSNLKKENSKLKKENTMLKEKNMNVNNQIKAIKSTKSWKMTKPIRIVNSKFKK